MVKKPPANVGDKRHMGSMPGSGRYVQEEMATPSSILVQEIPWTERPGGLQSMGLQKGQTQLSD